MLNLLRRAAAPRARAARGLVTLIMGPPGGGKGTLSKKIVREFDVAPRRRPATDLDLAAKVSTVRDEPRTCSLLDLQVAAERCSQPDRC